MRSWKLEPAPSLDVKVKGATSGNTYAFIDEKWVAINPDTGQTIMVAVHDWDEPLCFFWHWHDLLEAEGELTEVLSPPKVGMTLGSAEEFKRLSVHSMVRDPDGVLFLKISELQWLRISRLDILRVTVDNIPPSTVVYLDA